MERSDVDAYDEDDDDDFDDTKDWDKKCWGDSRSDAIDGI